MDQPNDIHPLQHAAELRLLAAAIELQHLTSTAANIVCIPGGERVIVIGTPAEAGLLLAITPAEPASLKQEKLRALADRIDHEKLWQRPAMDRDRLTDEQRDRLDAGIMLRRYADLLAPGRWLVLPPTGCVQFSASTLEKVTEMAKRDQARCALSEVVPTDVEHDHSEGGHHD